MRKVGKMGKVGKVGEVGEVGKVGEMRKVGEMGEMGESCFLERNLTAYKIVCYFDTLLSYINLLQIDKGLTYYP